MPRKKNEPRPSGRTVLIVDDNAEYLAATARLIANEGHEVLTAPGGVEALGILRARSVDLVLVDYFMPGMSGEEFVEELRRFNHRTQVILQTGYASERPPREMLERLDIQGFHDKSEGPEKLSLWIAVGLKAAFTVQLLERTRLGLTYILGVTPALHRIQPLEDLLQGILVQTCGLLGAVDSFLAILDGPSASPAVVPSLLATPEASGGLWVRAGTGRFAAREPLDRALPSATVEDVTLAMADGRILRLEGATILPLRVGDTNVGVIYLDRPTPVEQDLDLLAVFANQAAVAIQNATLYELAAVDPLTRVYTRRFFEQALERELRAADRGGRPVALLLVEAADLDQVNARAGHVEGDAILTRVGAVLKRSVRAIDSVGRWSGGTFAVLLPDTDRSGAETVASRIASALASIEGGAAMRIGLAVVAMAERAPGSGARTHQFFEETAAGLVRDARAHLAGADGRGRERPDDARHAPAAR